MTLHLQHAPNLLEVDVLPPSQTDDLVPRAQDLKADPQHVLLSNRTSTSPTRQLRDDARSEGESRKVEEDVGLGVGDEEDVEVFEGRVDEADARGFEDGVL